jgi:hypothetical protein
VTNWGPLLVQEEAGGWIGRSEAQPVGSSASHHRHADDVGHKLRIRGSSSSPALSASSRSFL